VGKSSKKLLINREFKERRVIMFDLLSLFNTFAAGVCFTCILDTYKRHQIKRLWLFVFLTIGNILCALFL
jgi:hypothetical protein